MKRLKYLQLILSLSVLVGVGILFYDYFWDPALLSVMQEKTTLYALLCAFSGSQIIEYQIGISPKGLPTKKQIEEVTLKATSAECAELHRSIHFRREIVESSGFLRTTGGVVWNSTKFGLGIGGIIAAIPTMGLSLALAVPGAFESFKGALPANRDRLERVKEHASKLKEEWVRFSKKCLSFGGISGPPPSSATTYYSVQKID